jgi:hypothetical protein
VSEHRPLQHTLAWRELRKAVNACERVGLEEFRDVIELFRKRDLVMSDITYGMTEEQKRSREQYMREREAKRAEANEPLVPLIVVAT